MFFLLQPFFITAEGRDEMTAVRNPDGKVVCYLDEKTNTIEIKLKDCKTVIRFSPQGKPQIVHTIMTRN